MKTIFSQTSEGQWYEIRNWQTRTDPYDLIIKRPLSHWERNLVQDMRKQGYDDSEIYFRIAELTAKENDTQQNALSIRLEELTKKQLVNIASAALGEAAKHLASMEKMNHEDLVNLLRALLRDKEIDLVVKR